MAVMFPIIAMIITTMAIKKHIYPIIFEIKTTDFISSYPFHLLRYRTS